MNKPIIVVVDDDLQILRTIVRDLRNQYGSSYRILSSDSGEKMLEVLPLLKLQNKSVSLFVIDQRMPKITGIEFLEQARTIFPDAKRVLLTAYADTSVAINAINIINIDYYLTKPWTPPEENLYPVLNNLLEVWRLSHFSVQQCIQILGCRWSSKTHQVKDFLASYHVPYICRDLNRDREARQIMEKNNQDFSQLPLILFPDGSQMVSPSTGEIAEKMGLQTPVQMPFYDLIIIGGGAAGLAAAVYGSSEGLKTVLIENPTPGEQAVTSPPMQHYLSFLGDLTGGNLSKQSVAQAYKLGTEIIAPQEVTKVKVNNRYKYVSLTDNTELSCHSVIVATGVSYKKLEISGMSNLISAGVYYGAAIAEAISCCGEDIYIVGNTDSAGQAAMYLANYARSVTILLKEESLTTKMSKYLIDRIQIIDNIRVKAGTEIVEVSGTEKLETLTLVNLKTGTMETVDATALFVLIGAKPNTNWIKDVIECDLDGYIVTGNDLIERSKQESKWSLARDPFLFETCVPGMFAIGDVRCNSIKRATTAVGEGSIAVQLVHQYLASAY